MSVTIDELLKVMARLRDPNDGCPWDRAQTFASLVPHTLEEAYEVAEAIEQGHFSALCGELGDLLFQVVFYAQLAEEQRLFNFSAVVTAIVEKLVRRHPHVFGKIRCEDPEALSTAWAQQKVQERAERGEPTASLMDGVSLHLPGATRAIKLQRRAATVGFDWREPDALLDKLAEEAAELNQARSEGADPERIMAEVGDLLFTCVNLARHHGVDAETALRQANARFERRFRRMEELAVLRATSLFVLDPLEQERLWECAKSEERSAQRLSGDPERR